MSTTAPFRGSARAAGYTETDAPPPPFQPEIVDEASEFDEASAPEPAPVELEAESVEAAPEPVSVDLADLIGPEQVAPAAEGVRGLLGKVGLRLQPSARELAHRAAAAQLEQHEATIRQATFPRAVGILVANRKGGVGKTPTSVILGGVLASIRGGSVAILEVSDDPGTLTFRAEGTPTRGIGELVTDAGSIRSAGQLASYTAPQTSFASIIGTTGPRPRLDRDAVTGTARVVDNYYGIRVMDSGNQPSSDAFEGALAVTDALVIPVLNSAEAVGEAIALIDHLRTLGGHHADLADQATILRLTDGRTENPALTENITTVLGQHRLTRIYEIPYDAHIAERGPITLAKLQATTRIAFVTATAAIIATLQNQQITENE
ncbi:MinD/ParA family ATP-binding protein [Schumannella soli]|uniref:CobQ/CobB/MinD/ParA nucleotide binding domain-containing protein n=1 Tax=Schumannella soli TaxID=2590779 RepID=A0A506Y834_9MICO|nr:hypothetical protein [Schumannella soli]TPW78043.1 hypothetical protein FJ657_05295 [Schumannella soli]